MDVNNGAKAQRHNGITAQRHNGIMTKRQTPMDPLLGEPALSGAKGVWDGLMQGIMTRRFEENNPLSVGV
jgi:hypothetical protein